MRKLIVTIVVLAVLGAGGYYGYRYWVSRNNVIPDWKTTPVVRGELLATIGATGTVEPEQVIDVGAQVAGLILSFGKDVAGKTIDYDSRVQEGTVLAKIDDSTYQMDLAQANAALAQAQATVVQDVAGIAFAEANLKQNQAKSDQARRDWDRAQKLGPSDALSQSSYDAYQGTYEAAAANVAVSAASVDQAKAAVAQAKAAVESAAAGVQRATRDLSYCVITSPVNGVIIDRRVNIGQTVVSSLSAPSLFLIAQDLTRIQVWIAVNEADIGSIHPGQPVTFTVDAIPDRVFKGQVNKVRLNAQMTSNVVTYTVEVTANNADGALLPYLTANAQFEVARHPDVLMVPNTALRWAPWPQYVVADAQTGQRGRRGERQARDGDGPATRPSSRESDGGTAGSSRGMVWVKDPSGLLRPVQVRVGMSDGAMTEVMGKNVTEGMEVVVGEQRNDVAAAPGSAASPFTPTFNRRR